nr:glycosyltransferase [uncultured Pseudodesulfovibrio sp.]
MKEKLRILFIHKDPCSRAYKEAVSLNRMGHTIDLACEALDDHPNISEYIDKIYTYKDLEELADIIRKGHWDIIHGHNEPNEPTEVAIRNANGCPVVFDCHDFRGLRQKLDDREKVTEKCCFEESDGVIVVSERMTQVVAQYYDTKRTISLPCFCLTSEMQRVFKDKLDGNHMVYQGMLLDAGIYPLEYRNYHPFFKDFTDNGVNVHVYCSHFNPRVQGTYIELQNSTELFHFHQYMPYADLLEDMSQYQWGLTAFNVSEITEEKRLTFLNSILPNKLFDYLFSGITPIVCNNETAGEWAEKHDLGYYARTEAEMLDIMLNEKPKPLMEDVSLISMEQHTVAIQNLYYEVLANRRGEA